MPDPRNEIAGALVTGMEFMTEAERYEETHRRLSRPSDWDTLGIIQDVLARLGETDGEAKAVIEYLADLCGRGLS